MPRHRGAMSKKELLSAQEATDCTKNRGDSLLAMFVTFYCLL
jgi:hypothetical protein